MKKHILLISHASNRGGAQTVFLSVIKSLYGCAILSIAIPVTKYEKSHYEEIAEFTKDKKDIKLLKIRYFKASKFQLVSAIFNKLINILEIVILFFYIKKNKVEIIYSSSILNRIGYILSRIAKVAHIWHIHEMDNSGINWIPNKYYIFYKEAFLKSKIIYVSKSAKLSWHHRLAIEKENNSEFIVYNPIKKIEERKSSNRNNTFIIGCAANYDNNKNQQSLINVIGKMQLNSKYDIRLILAGDKIPIKLNQIASKILTKDSYKLYDYIPIEKLLYQIDILVVPSYAESWSLVALEAISANVPVILTKETSLKEILEDKKNVIFIDPYSEKDIYDKICLLIDNYEYYCNQFFVNNKIILEKYSFNENFKKNICKILLEDI